MSSSSIDALQAKLGHHFTDARLLLRALTHKSFDPRQSNERLEFLGDSIVNYCVADMLHRRYEALSEGEMSRIRAGLVCHESLVKIAVNIGLARLLRVSETFRGGRSRESILSDALEALFAAVQLDAGHEKAKQLVEVHILALLESGQVELSKDPKTSLQEFLQARAIPVPAYELLTKGEPGKRPFAVTCSIPRLNIQSTGTGGNRKQAEKDAAAKAMALCPR
ncbi:ribonuclease III [Massilia sp. erpn]|uniref:ribonuclease III n=1 Tax=Massilia sp. erpn TaxID=2738142 RepID=UPI00210792C6|nr:ribonuclease III [Massilia sp. erpn]UTY55852.1 ribonuclease III [Massilia sp. erpn]